MDDTTAAATAKIDPDKLGIVDDSPEDIDEETFDLDAWIDGVEPTTRSVRIYQRADLLGRYDELEQELRVAKKVPEKDRGVADRGPQSIEQEMFLVAQQLEDSARWFKIRGMSDAARDKIEKPLRKQKVDQDDIDMRVLSEAIVSPRGVTPAHLRKLGERNEVQLKMLQVAFTMACTAPPKVSAPLSDGSSGGSRTRGR